MKRRKAVLVVLVAVCISLGVGARLTQNANGHVGLLCGEVLRCDASLHSPYARFFSDFALSPDGLHLYLHAPSSNSSTGVQRLDLSSKPEEIKGVFGSGMAMPSLKLAPIDSGHQYYLSPDTRGVLAADQHGVFHGSGDGRVRYSTFPAGAEGRLEFFAGSTQDVSAYDFPPGNAGPIGGMVVAPDGRCLYVSEPANDRILCLNIGSQGGSLFAGGKKGRELWKSDRLKTELNGPTALAISPNGEHLFVSDAGNHRVLKLGTKSREADLVVGGRVGKQLDPNDAKRTLLFGPRGLAVSRDGGTVYVIDVKPPAPVDWRKKVVHRVLKVNSNGTVHRVLGGIEGTAINRKHPDQTQLLDPTTITTTPDGSLLVLHRPDGKPRILLAGADGEYEKTLRHAIKTDDESSLRLLANNSVANALRCTSARLANPTRPKGPCGEPNLGQLETEIAPRPILADIVGLIAKYADQDRFPLVWRARLALHLLLEKRERARTKMSAAALAELEAEAEEVKEAKARRQQQKIDRIKEATRKRFEAEDPVADERQADLKSAKN